MRRSFGLAGAVLGMALLWVIVGCGDDDSTSSKLKTGDLDDPEFQAAIRAMDMTNVDDPTKMVFNDLSDFVQQIMNQPGAGADRDEPGGMAQQVWQITYHTDSKYWHRTFQFTQDPWMNLVDSLQFVHIDGPAPYPVPDSLIEFRMGTAQYAGEAAETLLVGNRLCSVAADYSDVPTITINLTQRLEQHGLLQKQGAVTDLDMVATTTVTDAVIDPSTDLDCPESGEAKSTVNLFVEYYTGDTTLTFNGNWRVDATFDGDSTIVSMNNGTTRWTFTEYCITVKDGTSPTLTDLLNRQ